MQYKKLIRKNVVLEDSLKVKDSTVLVPTRNIELVGVDDPKKVFLPTIDEVVRIGNQLKETTFNVIYKQTVLNVISFPDMELINSLYFSDGIYVLTMDGSERVRLMNDTTGIPATGSEYDRVTSLNDNEGLLFIVEETGLWEIAGYVGGQIIMSNQKIETPAAINQLQSDIAALKVSVNANTADVSFMKDSKLNRGQITDITQLATVTQLNTAVGVKQNALLTAETGFTSNSIPGRLTELRTGKLDKSTLSTIQSTADIYHKSEIDAKVTSLTTGVATKANQTDLLALETKVNTNTDTLTRPTTGVEARLQKLEAPSAASQYVTAINKYASDAGQPQLAGGTALKATFDLANLINDNTGTNPKLNFNDESIFNIKIRFTIDGLTGAAANRNMLFSINTGDAEPTILMFNDRNGQTANAGVTLRATLSTAGQLVIDVKNVDGTDPAFSVINFSTMTVNQIEQLIWTKASAIAQMSDLVALQNGINANTASISGNTNEVNALKTRTAALEDNFTKTGGVNEKLTSLEAGLNAKQNSTDINLQTSEKTIVGAINNLFNDKADAVDFQKVQLSATGLAALVDLETKLGI